MSLLVSQRSNVSAMSLTPGGSSTALIEPRSSCGTGVTGRGGTCFERRKIKMEWSPARFQFLVSARQNLRRPALLEQALILGGSSFERAFSKRNAHNSDCAPHDVNRSLLNSPHRARLCPCPSTAQKSRLKVMSISGPEAKISGSQRIPNRSV